jgi:hypothetical protein
VVADDSTGRPIQSVLVSLLSSSGAEALRSVRTDSAGRYTLRVGVAGTYRIKVTQIGYQPLTSQATRFSGAEAVTLDFSMSASAVNLGTIVVRERRRLNRDELMSTLGFDLRRSRGVGLFLNSADMAPYKRTPIAFVLDRYGTVPHITLEGQGLSMVRGLGTCSPQFFVDGWASPSWLIFGLGADDIHGIEVYSRTLLPPPSLGAEIGDYGGARTSAKCGAIAIWTKRYHASLLAREGKRVPR